MADAFWVNENRVYTRNNTHEAKTMRPSSPPRPRPKCTPVGSDLWYNGLLCLQARRLPQPLSGLWVLVFSAGPSGRAQSAEG